MFKIIGIVMLVLLFFALLALMLFASAILSIIRKLRRTIYGDAYKKDDYTGRRQQQYSYRSRTYGQQTKNTQQATNNYTDSETIIDTRSPRQSSNRIFDDNEGEYVDFVEEQ